jgi:hypothetical protein
MEETETTIHNELVRCNKFLGENPQIRQVLNRRGFSANMTYTDVLQGCPGGKYGTHRWGSSRQ